MEYKKLMKTILLSKPNERKTAKESLDELNRIFRHINPKEINRIRIGLKKDFSNREHVVKIKKRMGRAKESALIQTDLLMNKLAQ
jgi:hypothetical protein